MDYKTTTLVTEVKCERAEIADFPSMKFGNLPNGQSVFDYTQYFEDNGLEHIDHKVFGRICKCFINALVTRLELNAAELFYQNTDGHILAQKELAMLFLQFANPDIFTYFDQMLWSLMENGMAFSDGFVASLAATRLPDDVLNEIMNIIKK